MHTVHNITLRHTTLTKPHTPLEALAIDFLVGVRGNDKGEDGKGLGEWLDAASQNRLKKTRAAWVSAIGKHSAPAPSTSLQTPPPLLVLRITLATVAKDCFSSELPAKLNRNVFRVSLT